MAHAKAVSAESRTIASIPMRTATRVARAVCPVLITGETGAGKGHLARWLHDHGPRGDRPFVPVNCGAIPEGVIDSHLFGHERGAFSDAHQQHKGLVGAAEGGTLFLDEVAELSRAAQLRLLRLLEEREVQPVGAALPRPSDVRIVAATSGDLRTLVAEGRFREDLYYRLEVIHLRVAPLRRRREAIPALTLKLTESVATRMERPPLEYAAPTLRVLQEARWSGNVRELRTVIERLHIFLEDEVVTPDHLLAVARFGSSASPAPPAKPETSRTVTARRALEACGGNITRAARALGVHRSTVHRWLAASSFA